MQNNSGGNIFEYILDQVNIVDVLSHYIHLERAGRNHKALCPFHNEKTASFIISEEKQLFHCFGCGVAGNAINFIMQYENLDYIDAVELLADRYHIDISAFKKGDKKNTGNLTGLYDILRDAAIYYYKNLRTAQSALSYLDRRGIGFDVIKQFGLGYANDAWQDVTNMLVGKYGADTLEKAGLATRGKDQKRLYDRFRNRIIFPIINPKGKVVGFGGRVMDDSLPKYLNSPETDVFNKSQTLYGLNLAKNNLADKKRLIITEGYMDVIAMHMNGFNQAVATLGTALTKEHGRLMKRYAEEIIICYDSDFAGQKATLRSLDVLEGIIDKIKVIKLGENLDPDEYIKKYGIERMQAKLDQAMSSTEYRLENLKQDYNLGDETQKIEYISKAVNILKGVSNEFEKNLYIEHLSRDLNINAELIAREAYQEQYDERIRYGFTGSQKKASNQPKDRKTVLEQQMLTYYIKNIGELLAEQRQLIEMFQYSGSIQPLMDYLSSYFKTHEVFSRQDIIENADIEIARQLIELLDLSEQAPEHIDIEHIMNLVLLMNLDEKIEKLNADMAQNPDQATKAKWQSLILKRNQIKRQTQLKR
ncbi:MAG: primase [Clostridiales bacterium]|nr:primase [Clostridiales bacterium]